MKREALRATSTIPVAPTTLYFAWIDSTHHSSMTGMTAKIDPVVGAKYSAANGYVTGKLVILDLGRRIVMSWRTTDFPRDAIDSRVEVHFETLGPSTRILILHTDIPEGQSEKYKSLWNDKYIAPMRAYFSKFLPDPRNPPPRRIPPPPPEDDEEEEEEEKPLKGKGKLGKAPPPAKSSSPGLHKTEAKGGKPAPKVAAKSPPPKAAPAKPAPKAAPAKPAPAKPAPKKAAPAKPAPKAAPKPAKPAPKPAAKKAPAKPAPKKAPAKPAPKKKPAAKPAKKK